MVGIDGLVEVGVVVMVVMGLYGVEWELWW